MTNASYRDEWIAEEWLVDQAAQTLIAIALALGCRIVPMFGQEGIDDLPPERYSAALLDAVLAGWLLEDTEVAILRDWIKGRKGEGEEMSGLVVREQEKLGGSAPVNQMLVELSRLVESGELKPGPENAELMTSALAG